MSRKNGPESSQDKAKTCARWIRSLGVMAKDGDTTDLTLLNDLHDVIDDAIAEAAVRLHDEHGYSYEEIARGLGISKQAVAKRYFVREAGSSAA